MRSYAKWTTKEQLEEYLTKVNKGTKIKQSGIPYYSEQETLYIDSSEGHNLVIGEAGSGKVQTTIIPQIKLASLAGESIVVNDIKGNVYQNTAKFLKENDYNIQIVNLDDLNLSNNYNPLSLPYTLYKEGFKDKAIEVVDSLAYYLFTEVDEKQTDFFWITSTINFFTGLTLYLFENAKEEEINLQSVYNLSIEGEEKKDNLRYFDTILAKLPKTSPIYISLSGTVNSPIETRSGIISTFTNKMKTYLARENLINMLSNNDIDLKNFSNTKTAIYIINNNTKPISNLVSLLIDQIIASIDVFGTKEKRTIMILDEFDTLLPIRNFTSVVDRSRGLNIKITAIISNFIKLKNTYGKEQSEIVKYCFPNIIYLMTKDIHTCKEISTLCGEQYNKESKTTLPLISEEELRVLLQNEAVILKVRMMPIRTTLVPDYQINWSISSQTDNKFPQRQSKDVKIFSIK